LTAKVTLCEGRFLLMLSLNAKILIVQHFMVYKNVLDPLVLHKDVIPSISCVALAVITRWMLTELAFLKWNWEPAINVYFFGQ